QVLWQIGKLYADTYLDTPSAKLSHVKAILFIDRMDFAYALADVVIARAGAITISELALTGKPVILVPSPYVTADHQTHNAKSLAKLGAAVLIKDGDAPQKAFPEALRMLEHPEELQKLEYEIMKLAKQNAADDIADIIIQLAQKINTST
ncbi:MAG: glycosyltransferase, partial [Saprospiraceae bacterium]